jgi:hypothetical protein
VKRIIAVLLLAALPGIAFAQRERGGGGGGGARASQPVARPAPQQVSRPQAQGGFDFNRDIAPRAPVQQQQQARPQPQVRQQQPQVRQQQPAARPARVPQPIARGFHGVVVHNPHGGGEAWYWNRGVNWTPAPIYWGGGFWGPWAFADLSAAILFGSIVDANNDVYQSYQVEPNSPGAQVLSDYGLQQTPCGPPNLVVMWGPDNSVICAFPNAMVAPGNYQIDPSTLTLVSQ